MEWHPPRPEQAAFAKLVTCLIVLFSHGCSRSNEPAKPSQASASAPRASASAAPRPSREIATLPPAQHLLSTDSSAYSSVLGSDEERIYLLTSHAAFRLAPGLPPERRPLPLGTSPVVRRDDFVYWSEGALQSVPKAGGEATVVAKIARMPRQLVGSRERVAWLDRDESNFSIKTSAPAGVRELYATSDYVATLAMDDEAAYFVQRAADKSWRLGKVSLSGGPSRFTAPHTSRTPAMMAIDQALYYYDGPSSSVHRVTLDLERDDVIANDVICSPIAVAEQVYCAQPAGIVEISLTGDSRRVLSMPDGVTITALTATNRWLAWIADTGEVKLAVNATRLD